MSSSANVCTHFKDVCNCGRSVISMNEVGELSEHYLSLVLHALVTRNTEPDNKGVVLTVEPEVIKDTSSLRLRCNGVLEVCTGFNGNVVNYSRLCIHVVLLIIHIWKRGNTESKYLCTVEELLIYTLTKSHLRNASVLLDMYVEATK